MVGVLSVVSGPPVEQHRDDMADGAPECPPQIPTLPRGYSSQNGHVPYDSRASQYRSDGSETGRSKFNTHCPAKTTNNYHYAGLLLQLLRRRGHKDTQ